MMTHFGQDSEPEVNSAHERRPPGHNQRQTGGMFTFSQQEQEQDDDTDHEDGQLLGDALLAVASAEEYAAKIIKLQQACLTPLKEDLADWLNKIMNTSTITADNFMDKLDNGVIICRLAKVISLWCQQQLAGLTETLPQPPQPAARASSHIRLDHFAPSQPSPNSPAYSSSNKHSISTSNVHSPTNKDSILTADDQNDHNRTIGALVTPFRRPQARLLAANNMGPLKGASQSTNCLAIPTISTNMSYSRNQFLNNLISMEQTKIWDEAKCRTFYARDNVCNFIRWSKEFGVNQSVLFESDDLVLHANPRQVVLCLLDVARIACVKHGFTEAPGLVRFEQEIDRELAAEKEAATNVQSPSDGYAHHGDIHMLTNEVLASSKSSLARKSRGASIADATDELILRYCKHKEEEAARIKASELEAARLKVEEDDKEEEEAKAVEDVAKLDSLNVTFDSDTLTQAMNDSEIGIESPQENDNSVMRSRSGEFVKSTLNYDNRVDSLDSGEGRTESASTSHSRTPVNVSRKSSAIPTLIKRSNSSSSLTSQTSSMGTSELSSSRSSLLSNQESTSAKRPIASDLDGKVMRIAKSYYGKGATKGVTRLSEGKYKIADRIVFVRLLKGHRVMVRIGGGWDTLENFLFRHKSDPSQVIDVDNLLPLESKMTFEKNSQVTPVNNKFSKLPYYRRSSSVSSTNLSVSNLSVLNHSPSSSASTSSTNNTTPLNTPNGPETAPRQIMTNNKQIPYLLIHRNLNTKTPQPAFYDHTSQNAHIKGPTSKAQTNRYNHRPLGSSRTPTASSTNLYPATLTTRLASANVKTMAAAQKVGSSAKQEALKKLCRSNDSLQASYYKSAQYRQHQQNFFSQNGNLGAKRKVDSQRRSTNGLIRRINGVNI